jgi:hypothetical protein
MTMHDEHEPNQGEEGVQPTVELPVAGIQPASDPQAAPGAGPAGAPGEHIAPPSEHVPEATEQFPPAEHHGYVTPPPPPATSAGDGGAGSSDSSGGASGGGGGGGWDGGTFSAGQPERKRHRGKLVALIAVGLLLLGGVAFAGVMLVNKTSAASDQLAKMVPASDQLYATAYLDPGAEQKINLRDLLERFPALQGKNPVDKVDEALEQLLKPTGLSYAEDVKPWLGNQLAVTGKLDDSGNPDVAVLISTSDDDKALATMHRLEGLSSNADITWSSTTYQGVDVRVGKSGSDSSNGALGGLGSNPAYAVVDHVLVVGSSLDRIQRVIDADQGTTSQLSGDPNFQKARDALPGEVLGMAYLNVGDLIDKAIPQLEAGLGFADLPPGCGGDQVTKSLDAIRAFRGLALSATAETDGLQFDAALAIDRSKLPSEAATAVAASDHQNAGLSFTPKDAFGVIGFNGAGLLNTELGTFGKCSPKVDQQLQSLGVKDILSNLSGDMAVEVSPGSDGGGVPGGALIAAVKDEAKMKTSLDRLATKLLAQGGQAGGPVKPTSETYKGVTIESISQPGDQSIAPAWAVTNGVAIIATTPAEVKAAIDAHGGEGITSSANFQQAATHVDLNSGNLVYADISAILDAVETNVSSGGDAATEAILANVRPVKATILQSGLDGDVLTVRWFFLVP